MDNKGAYDDYGRKQNESMSGKTNLMRETASSIIIAARRLEETEPGRFGVESLILPPDGFLLLCDIKRLGVGQGEMRDLKRMEI